MGISGALDFTSMTRCCEGCGEFRPDQNFCCLYWTSALRSRKSVVCPSSFPEWWISAGVKFCLCLRSAIDFGYAEDISWMQSFFFHASTIAIPMKIFAWKRSQLETWHCTLQRRNHFLDAVRRRTASGPRHTEVPPKNQWSTNCSSILFSTKRK